jgi:hypothetical protein
MPGPLAAEKKVPGDSGGVTSKKPRRTRPKSLRTPDVMRCVCPWRNPPSRLRGIEIWTASALLTPGVTAPRTESGFQARIRTSGTELSVGSKRNTPCPSANSDRGRQNRRSCCWASTSLTTIPPKGEPRPQSSHPRRDPIHRLLEQRGPRPDRAARRPIPPKTPLLATRAIEAPERAA